VSSSLEGGVLVGVELAGPLALVWWADTLPNTATYVVQHHKFDRVICISTQQHLLT
jgi:hypothetical protein